MTDEQPPTPERPGTDPHATPSDATQEIGRHEPTREIPAPNPAVHSNVPASTDAAMPASEAPSWAASAPPPPPSGGVGGPQGPAYGQGGGFAQAPPPRRRRSDWWKMPTTALAAALLASAGTVALTSHDDSSGTRPASSNVPSSLSTSLTTKAPLDQGGSTAPDWKATASAVSPSVVSISVEDSSGNGGEGSGVIIDAQGHIVTNNHVVGGSGSDPKIVVTLEDQRAFQAKIVGLDPSTDLAVIQLQGTVKDLRPVAIGDSDKISVGAPVMAVGNPLGLSGTVTTGIVSALNRPVMTSKSTQQDPMGGLFGQSQQSGNEVITNAIQTSAPINPGNSGGALVNADGQLIGINSSIASTGSSSSGQGGSIGIGFAIPVNEVTSIAEQLIKSGKAEHAFLGVTSTTGMVKDGEGQRVAAVISNVVSDSPASKAGLQDKDAIIEIDGEPVTGSQSLVGQVRERKVGDKASVVYLRDGKRHQLEVTFAVKSSD